MRRVVNATEANGDIHIGYAVAGWRRGESTKTQRAWRNVDDPVLFLDVEMLMIADISVEVRSAGPDGNATYQAYVGKLIEGVVDRGQRQRHAGLLYIITQFICRNVPMLSAEQ